MTEALASKTCTPCRGGIPPLTREQAELFHEQAPDWQLSEEAHRIERRFQFRDFREALTFVQEIGELAEAEGHHPNISFGWGNATVSLQTKKIKGLHGTIKFEWPMETEPFQAWVYLAQRAFHRYNMMRAEVITKHIGLLPARQQFTEENRRCRLHYSSATGYLV